MQTDQIDVEKPSPDLRTQLTTDTGCNPGRSDYQKSPDSAAIRGSIQTKDKTHER
jgi:hypothetical protein